MGTGEPSDLPNGAVPLDVPITSVGQQATPSGGSTAMQAGRDITVITEQHFHQTPANERPAAPRPSGGRVAPGAIDELGNLVDALLDVPSIRDDVARSAVLALLPSRIASSVPYHPRARLHVIGLVRTCLNYEGGLAELLAALREVEGDSLALRCLADRARRWTNT